MSSKRQAGAQVTRENYRELEERDDDLADRPVKASAEVLAKRKILKPRSRIAGRATQSSISASSGFNFNPTQTKSNDKPANVFGAFAGFGTKQSSATVPSTTTTTKTTTGAFNFGSTSIPSGFGFGTQKKAPEVDLKEKDEPKKVSSFLSESWSNNSSTSSLVPVKDTDKPSKIKALNDSFYEKISEQIQVDPVSNFKPILNKYIDYYDAISNDYDIPDADSESQYQEGENSKPKALPPAPISSSFNFSPSSTKPASGFGAATKPSPSNIPRPIFGDINKGPTRSFGKPTNETPEPESGKEPHHEVIDVDAHSDSDDDIKVEGPKFTLSKPVETSDSVFKLSKDTKATNSQGSGPSFTFAGASKKVDSVFKLTPPKPEEPKKEELPKPGFSFGSANLSKSSQSFTWSTDKPINFGSNLGNNLKKNLDSLSSSPSNTFNYTGTVKSDGAKNENGQEDTSAKPAFSFNFSANSNTTGAETNDVKNDTGSKPAFSFGNGSNFNFTFNKPAVSADQAAAALGIGNNNGGEAENGNDDKVEEVEVKGDFKVPTVKLGEKVEEKTGEEEEEVLYTKKSKISLYNSESKKYDSKGLGELKVLRNRNTKKSRVLVRADGSNRVILNVAIVSGFNYETTGKGNFVKIPAAGSGSIDLYMAQVKTADDGGNLLNALQKAQKST